MALTLVLGGLAARDGTSLPDPSPAVGAATEAPDRHYGPNPNRRLSPQIDRIIRLAQRRRSDDEKKGLSDSPQFKSPPVQKKTAPKPRLKTPSVKKKAPAVKKSAPKRRKAPAVKKKKKAPAPKREAPIKKKAEPPKKEAPVSKKAPPVETAPPAKKAPPVETAPKAGPTDDQLRENKTFCAQNPNSPKCRPQGTPPDQQQENEAFCAKNPDSPKCGPQETSPEAPKETLLPPGDAGQVPSVCEQNPALQQCQRKARPDEEPTSEPEPSDESETDREPPFPPQDDTPPLPPVPPPPPPPPSDEQETESSGPQIQTVTECPADQVRFGDACVYPGGCPDGEVETAGGEAGLQCGESCIEGQVSVVGQCVGEGYCFNLGGVAFEGECLTQCPAETYELNGRCLRQDECQSGFVGEGPDNCRQCEGAGGAIVDGECQCDEPTYVESTDPSSFAFCEPCNQSVYEGQCVAACPEGTLYSGAGITECVNDCPDGTTAFPKMGDSEAHCSPQCPDGQLTEFTRCVDSCSTGYVAHEGKCLSSCPEGTVDIEGQCLDACPEGQVAFDGECILDCPEDQYYSVDDDSCKPQNCQPGEYKDATGDCVAECPQGTTPHPGFGNSPHCQPQCPDGQFAEYTRCVDECGSEYDIVADGACYSACPDGQTQSGNQCVGECREDQIALPSGLCAPRCSQGQGFFAGQCIDRGSCPGDGTEVGSSEDGIQCEETCPAGQVVLLGLCVSDQECADRGGIKRYGRCVDPCPEGEVRLDSGACAAQCLAGETAFAGMCVAEGNCSEGELGTFDGDCIDREECFDSVFTVEREGMCIGISPCMQSGGYWTNTQQCVEECPEGQTATGSVCSLQCETGQYESGSECVTQCPEGQVVVSGKYCRANCPDSMFEEDGSCLFTPTCADGETYFDGECTADEDVTRDDLEELCLDSVESGDTQPPDGMEDASSQEQCAVLVDEACEGGSFAGTAACPGSPADDETPPPADDEQPPPEEEPAEEEPAVEEPAEEAPAEEQPPAGEGRPDDQDQQSGRPPEDDEQPPAEETAPPPEDEAPPPQQTLPPPPEDAGEYGSICEQNPQLPLCQTLEADQDEPPPSLDEESPPPDDDQPPAPGKTAPPPSGGAPPPSGPPAGLPPASPPTDKAKPAPPVKKDVGEKPTGGPIAVVIAIDDYDDDTLEGSPQAIPNAAHLVRFLKSDLGMDDERIITGRNAERSAFDEIFGTSAGTKSELRDLVKKTKAKEVIVYYAGLAKALDGGKDVLLLPSDGDPAKPDTGVKLSALYSSLYGMGIRKLRLYLDPSFVNGEDVVELNSGARIGRFGAYTPRDWITLSAASDDADLPRDSDRPRSVFTESLVAGLRGIADTTGLGDGDGEISAKELHGFIANQAAAAARRGDKTPVPSFYGPPDETLRAY